VKEQIDQLVSPEVFKLLYFVVLTHACNLHCDYCGYEEGGEESTFKEVRYEVEDLKKFILQDTQPSIIFYGGEPLVRMSLMENIMDSIPAYRYLLQTNALRLRDVKSEYLGRFDAILVSIDGRKETTDSYRGKDVYSRILENLKLIREKGFQGDLIARMTASEQTDIFLDVSHLLELKNPKFDHVHWQIDALWDSPPELRWNDLDKWIAGSYDPGIVRLVNTWGNTMVEEKKVLPIVPFIGIMHTLLTGGVVDLRCGSGIDSFAVTTSGDVTVCPIAPEWDFAKVGTIFQSNPNDLPGKVNITEPCTKCETLGLCGGRCLFANRTKLWGEKGFRKICTSTTNMINELGKLKPVIDEMMSRGILSIADFNYPLFNNGCEIIP
jgi:putative peptide-modifying radical SAM enzyme